jgi:hypothetical protein
VEHVASIVGASGAHRTLLVAASGAAAWNCESKLSKTEMALSNFVPAIFAAATDLITVVIVRSLPQEYPFRVVLYQIVMLGLALLMATPYRLIWLVSFLMLMVGVLLAGFSIGMFYIPTVVAAGWVMVRRSEGVGTEGGNGSAERGNGPK